MEKQEINTASVLGPKLWNHVIWPSIEGEGTEHVDPDDFAVVVTDEYPANSKKSKKEPKGFSIFSLISSLLLVAQHPVFFSVTCICYPLCYKSFFGMKIIK